MKMNVLLKVFVFVFLLGSVNTFSQEISGTETKDSSNLYYHSLKKYLESSTDENSIYLEKDVITTEKIAGNFHLLDKRLKLVSEGELIKKAKKNRKSGVEFLRVIPVRFSNGRFFISVIRFKLVYSRRNLDYINLIGDKFYYNYDCENKTFEFLE